jgi:hypothetical protein
VTSRSLDDELEKLLGVQAHGLTWVCAKFCQVLACQLHLRAKRPRAIETFSIEMLTVVPRRARHACEPLRLRYA